MLTLGPFFNDTRTTACAEAGFQLTGCSIDFTLDGDFYSLPIHCRIWPEMKKLVLGLQDIFVIFERHIWPFHFDCYEHQVVSTRSGLFVEFGAFLHGFFTHLNPLSSAADILGEFLSIFPDLTSRPHLHPVDIAIDPSLMEKGYRLVEFHQFSTRLIVEFHRVLRFSGRPDFSILAARAIFTPKQMRLGNGTWEPIDRNGVLSGLFWHDFKTSFHGTPYDALFADKQRDAVLEIFKWKKITIESKASLIAQRKEFVNGCPASMTNMEIAEGLIKMELYSSNTSVNRIAETVGNWRKL